MIACDMMKQQTYFFILIADELDAQTYCFILIADELDLQTYLASFTWPMPCLLITHC
jgi:hypothetical protein